MALRTPRLTALLGGGGSIAVAMGVMNVATYGFTMIAARLLGPRSYGALASLMATLLVITVLQLGLQATAARRIAAEPEHVAQIEKTILGVTYRAAVALGVLLLVLTPLLDIVLRLDSLGTAALVSVVSVPFTIMGGQAGILQGERRWGALSILYLLSGLPRLVIGTALIVWQPSEAAALVGIGIGATFPVIAGWRFLRRPRESGVQSESHGFRNVIRESFHNSQVLLAFFALSNADIVVARNVLDGHDAGLYAGGLILTKAVLFLPQFVVVVAFPSMSTSSERRSALTLSLSLVAVLGAVTTAGAAVLPQLALIFVGGDNYDEIADHLWIFAILGTVLSMLQLLVYSVLARQGQRSAYLVWAAFVAVIALGLAADSLRGLLTVVIVVDALLLAALLTISLYVTRTRPMPEPIVTPQP
ncbi:MULTISPECIES: lipopolysaccharide biosynthesis protein [unclassified Nocardioides]|uniref:lipopolysaccharide biosynthesis protein n=1 Tax=unclassified Nocardioides TaxID=2615069 RepID=UPI0009F07512|nr:MULTISPECIES: oligosaccharide flippase family protein [unclassified Nocardioides]GAW51464.1 polysaccharide biosynthesis protein [Nocardioides sp. PD653-B2]GAW54102.1 polysaccharide biosynthesis protein [Nocardioides sp. PD653]